MSKNYDNWERLVEAVLRREKLRQLAMADSRNPSSISNGFSLIYQLIVYKELNNQSPIPDFNDVSIWKRLSQPSESDHYYGPMKSSLLGLFFLMVGSRNLTISCGDTSKDRRWLYSSSPYSFWPMELIAAEIESVLWLDIRGKMNTRILTPNTIYGAYLVFDLFNKFEGLKSVKASIRFVNDETESEAEERAEIVHLQPVDRRKGEAPVMREDEWMEVKIGNFYFDKGVEDEVEARVMETSCLKKGLLVQGIEFRPLYALKKCECIFSRAQEPNVLELINWKMGKNPKDVEFHSVDEIEEAKRTGFEPISSSTRPGLRSQTFTNRSLPLSNDQSMKTRLTTKVMGLWNIIKG